ncbi:MAG: multicopper oxidase domain-containing protein [Caldilineaceae bacterium]
MVCRNWRETGPNFVQRAYNYDNSQEAATLWYHDHALGITRLNVYAGLAGFYLLRDDNEENLIANNVLPSGPYEIGMAIQDRMFRANGRLFRPRRMRNCPPVRPIQHSGRVLWRLHPGQRHGLALPRCGAAQISLPPAQWLRFAFLHPETEQRPSLYGDWHGGRLPTAAVSVSEFWLMPGERIDLVIDFSTLNGQEIILQNFGPDSPFKGFGIDPPADPDTTGQIMQFRVNLPLGAVVPNATVGATTALRTEPIPTLTPTAARGVVLFEGMDAYGRLRPLVGMYHPDSALNQGSLAFTDPVTETPALNTSEVWEIYNTTEDAHPVHLHLVQFQVVNRQDFEFTLDVDPAGDGTGGTKFRLANPVLTGSPELPGPIESGRKDMVLALPGQVTRIKAHFDRPGRYMWHCHILSHEDHDMMRFFEVMDTGVTAASVDDAEETNGSVLDKNVYIPIVAR